MSSTGAPQPDGGLNKAGKMKIRNYRQIYADRPDPIVFLSVDVSTSGHVYEDFTRLPFLHTHREGSILVGEPVTISIDLSIRPFIPLPRFFNSRRVTPLLDQSLVLIPPQSA